MTRFKQTKNTLFILLSAALFLSGCNYDDQKRVLKEKEEELNVREADLALREKNLQLQQEEFSRIRDTALNKAVQDSSSYNPALVGIWDVKMNCIETNCPGSAIGDSKTEQWEISYIQNQVIASAIVDKKVVRNYVGTHSGNVVELHAQQSDSSALPHVNIMAHLQLKSDKNMEGRREITGENNCKIVYDLVMNKKLM